MRGRIKRTKTKQVAVERQAVKQAKFKATCEDYIEKGIEFQFNHSIPAKKLVDLNCTASIWCMDYGNKQAGGGFGMIEETIF